MIKCAGESLSSAPVSPLPSGNVGLCHPNIENIATCSMLFNVIALACSNRTI